MGLAGTTGELKRLQRRINKVDARNSRRGTHAWLVSTKQYAKKVGRACRKLTHVIPIERSQMELVVPRVEQKLAITLSTEALPS